MARKAMRQRLAPVVARGTVECARCGELIEPGSDWDLDHRDDGKGWLGPSHRSCNRRGGWEKMVGQNGNGAFIEETPCRLVTALVQRAPVGTEVFLGDGLVEVHVGRGIWQTVAPSA